MSIEVRFRIFKDTWSAWTHFVGFLGAVVGAVVLLVLSAGSAPKLVAMGGYGASLVLLFLASSVYHFFDIGERGNRWLQRADHMAIFLLIAGSYLPSVLLLLHGAWRVAMLWVIGGLAAAGVLLKLLFFDRSHRIGLVLYLLMGWVVLIPAHKIVPQLSGLEFGYLFGGGLAYTIGAVVYAREWPDPWPRTFGHHEIWHVLVLIGAASHYAYMICLLDQPYVPG